MLDKETKTNFLSLINLGHGFSKSCAKMSIDIKKASEYYQSKEGKTFAKEIRLKMKQGLSLYLSEYKKVLKLDKEMFGKRELLPILEDSIGNFISTVNLWGCGLNEFQKEELEESGKDELEGDGAIPITEEMISTGIEIYGNLREVATAYELTYDELICVVGCYPQLKKLLKQQVD
jgi:hypothetical protein